MRASVLMAAIERRDLTAVRVALAAGIPAEGSAWRRLVARRDPTPLLAAVRTNSIEIVKLLLDHGADPNRDTQAWRTPLAVAAYNGDRPMIELLLSRGATVNPPVRRHASAIEMAAWYNRPELVAFLLERGADPDLVLSRGDSSLVRVRAPILAMLMAAGGHAPPSIARMVEEEMVWLSERGKRLFVRLEELGWKRHDGTLVAPSGTISLDTTSRWPPDLNQLQRDMDLRRKHIEPVHETDPQTAEPALADVIQVLDVLREVFALFSRAAEVSPRRFE
jgi:hypothetical protein